MDIETNAALAGISLKVLHSIKLSPSSPTPATQINQNTHVNHPPNSPILKQAQSDNVSRPNSPVLKLFTIPKMSSTSSTPRPSPQDNPTLLDWGTDIKLKTTIISKTVVDTTPKTEITSTPKSVNDEHSSSGSARKYNLRRKLESQLLESSQEQLSSPIWIPRDNSDCFRNRVLSQVDKNYLAFHQDEHAKKVIDLSHKVQRSQMVAFQFQGKDFIAIGWLTSLRIFEYITSCAKYIEVKRIPQRFIQLTPRIITSVHYCDSKFYIAYLWGSMEDGQTSVKPFIEMRDIQGNIRGVPRYYDECVKSINSDENFVCVMTTSQKFYLHRRYLFEHIYYCIDMSNFTCYQLVSCWPSSPSYNSYTRVPILTATQSELLCTEFDILNHKEKMRFDFGDHFRIVSISSQIKSKKTPFYLILRNVDKSRPFESAIRSKLDLGHFIKSGNEAPFKIFISMSFDYNIIQSSIHEDKIYLLGFRDLAEDKRLYEIACLSAHDLKYLCTTILIEEVDENCHLLIHNGNIVIVRNSYEFFSIRNYANASPIELHKCLECKIHIPKEQKKSHEDFEHKTLFTYINWNTKTE